jgi:hypothetical protein
MNSRGLCFWSVVTFIFVEGVPHNPILGFRNRLPPPQAEAGSHRGQWLHAADTSPTAAQ